MGTKSLYSLPRLEQMDAQQRELNTKLMTLVDNALVGLVNAMENRIEDGCWEAWTKETMNEKKLMTALRVAMSMREKHGARVDQFARELARASKPAEPKAKRQKSAPVEEANNPENPTKTSLSDHIRDFLILNGHDPAIIKCMSDEQLIVDAMEELKPFLSHVKQVHACDEEYEELVQEGYHMFSSRGDKFNNPELVSAIRAHDLYAKGEKVFWLHLLEDVERPTTPVMEAAPAKRKRKHADTSARRPRALERTTSTRVMDVPACLLDD